MVTRAHVFVLPMFCRSTIVFSLVSPVSIDIRSVSTFNGRAGCWVITSKVTGDRVTAKLEEAGIVVGPSRGSASSRAEVTVLVHERQRHKKTSIAEGREMVRGRERGGTSNCSRRVI